jgi:hypothetical protein
MRDRLTWCFTEHSLEYGGPSGLPATLDYVAKKLESFFGAFIIWRDLNVETIVQECTK